MNQESRRQFLRQAPLEARSLRGNPPGLPIGLELYTVRNELRQDFAGRLKKWRPCIMRFGGRYARRRLFSAGRDASPPGLKPQAAISEM